MPEIEVNDIAKQCMDSQGYIIFAGVISKERDAKGAPMIEFSYKRYQLGLEDSFMALKQFKKHLTDDMEGLGREEAPNAGLA